jgi:hypothetical protein
MPSEANLLQKTRRPLATIAYPATTMALYIYGLHHKFAGATRIGYHLSDGRAVFQVGTYGANCGNRNRIGDRIANSQRLVETPRVAESDCVGSRSEVHKCISNAFL